MARIAVRPKATADLAGISTCLHRHAGPLVADHYRIDFRAAFRCLATFPESGAPRPALGLDVRLVTVKPYVVLHRYDRARDTVFILRVLHGRRRLALDAP